MLAIVVAWRAWVGGKMTVSERNRRLAQVRETRRQLREQLDIAEAEGFDMLVYLLDLALLETETNEADLVSGPK